MAEDKADLIRHYQQSRAGLFAAIEGLSDGLMTEPSLDGWSVKDHLAHIALWDELRTSEVIRISAGYASAWRMSPEQDEAYNAVAHDVRSELSLQQVRWELDTTRQRLMEALSAATEAGLDASRYGEAGLRSTHEMQHTEWILRWRQEKGV